MIRARVLQIRGPRGTRGRKQPRHPGSAAAAGGGEQVMKIDAVREREAAHFLPVVKRHPVALVEGRGARVRDVEGREFIVGDRFTLADVILYAFLEFGATVGQPLDAKLENLQGWYTRVASRPSIEASQRYHFRPSCC